MPPALETIINECYTPFMNVYNACWDMGEYLKDAAAEAQSGDLWGTGFYLDLAGNCAKDMSDDLHAWRPAAHFYLLDALEWINANWPSGAYL
ncbi:unnamed protein product, partial [marine sediment metagenome]